MLQSLVTAKQLYMLQLVYLAVLVPSGAIQWSLALYSA